MKINKKIIFFLSVALSAWNASGQNSDPESELRNSLKPDLVNQFSEDDIRFLKLDVLNLDLLQSRKQVAELQEKIGSDQLEINQLKKALHRAQLQALSLSFKTSEGIQKVTNLEIASEAATPTAAAAADTEEAFPLRAAIWKTRVIPVYWENPTEDNKQEREWIRQSIKNTWERHSAVQFIGWEKANPDSKGIRILLTDSHPHVKRLGRFLSGVKNGMELNITFKNWCPQCLASAGRQRSIEWIAIHEFGHALGYAHEHNRDDRDARCHAEPQGSNGDWKITVYDPDSIMNYCNSDWNNKGQLSELDILAQQILYGKPTEKSQEPIMPEESLLDPGPDPVSSGK